MSQMSSDVQGEHRRHDRRAATRRHGLDREDALAALAFATASLGPDAAPEADFPARLQRSIEENREILSRLAD
jgi:hypothetical protein